jgi:hypothetical protein
LALFKPQDLAKREQRRFGATDLKSPHTPVARLHATWRANIAQGLKPTVAP